jgi:hypothetical protein
MSSAPAPASPRPLVGILVGGGIAGAFDLTFALVFNGVRGVPPIKIPQVIASGVLGDDAFTGGAATAALGVVLHFVIALGAATVYALFTRAIGALHRHVYIAGPLFGAGIFLTMRLVVLPLSAAPHFKNDVVPILCDLACHMLLVGPSIALAARRYAGRA